MKIQRSRGSVILGQTGVQAGLSWAGLCLAATLASAATPLLNFEFNEGTGASTTDKVNQFVATFGSATGPVVSVADSPSGAANDKAVSLNAGSDTGQGFLAVNDSSSPILALAKDAFTMESWIKLDPADARQYEGIGAYGGSFKIGMQNQQLEFTLYGIIDITSGFFVPLDDAWHHVAAVWNPGVGVTLYLDGAANEIAETRLPRAFNNNILTIGAEGVGGNAMQGMIDRFRIHKAALTADQLDSNAKSPKAALASTLVAYTFNESAPPYPNAASTVRPAYSYRNPTFVSDTPSGKAGDFAIHFDPGQMAVVDDSSTKFQLDPADPSFTLQAWVKFSGKPATRQVFFYSNGPGGAISFSVNTNRTVFVTTLGVLDASSSAAIPDDGGWHHIAVVHENGKEIRYYVDGVLGGTRAYTGSVIFTRTQTLFYLGSEPNGGLQYVGSLDRLKVTNGILTVDQLDAWPIPGVPPAAPSLTIATVEKISWPTTPPGYKLQSSTDLGSVKNWTDVTDPPLLGTGVYYLLVSPTANKAFYRLIKP